jgi:hypothetical protein
MRDTLATIADGHPISRIEELMPWQSHERMTSSDSLPRRPHIWTGAPRHGWANVVDYLAAEEMMELFLDNPAAYVRNRGSMGLANNAPDHPIW